MSVSSVQCTDSYQRSLYLLQPGVLRSAGAGMQQAIWAAVVLVLHTQL